MLGIKLVEFSAKMDLVPCKEMNTLVNKNIVLTKVV